MVIWPIDKVGGKQSLGMIVQEKGCLYTGDTDQDDL